MADIELFDATAPVFTVTVAAGLADMHPQTLRTYDRLGLVVPKRARGRGRRYSLTDIAKLRHVQRLSQEDGINLEGIRRVLELEEQLEAAQEQNARLAQTLQRIQEDQAKARLFTAEVGGAVHLGRVRTKTILALPRA
ncbi:MAG: MerR family transcriptional regulator [Propionibacterium sp.]|nr:MAG: MerR family transcriptional regulator [Propionibacterium sp.]